MSNTCSKTYNDIKQSLRSSLEGELTNIFTLDFCSRFLDKLLECSSNIEEIRRVFTEHKVIVGTSDIVETAILSDKVLSKLSDIIYKSEIAIHVATRPSSHYELVKFYSKDTPKVIETNCNIYLLKEVLKLIDSNFEKLIFKVTRDMFSSGVCTSYTTKLKAYRDTIDKIDFNLVDARISGLTMLDIDSIRKSGNIAINRSLTTELELEDMKKAYFAYKPALIEGYCFCKWCSGSIVKDDLIR